MEGEFVLTAKQATEDAYTLNRGDSVRILLIDDDADIAAFLKDALTTVGYSVTYCSSGIAGLRVLVESPPDIAIVDVGLPDVSGYEVTRRARDRGIEVPILMLTAYSRVNERVQGLDSGADDYLVKPFALDELLARVRALGRRRGNIQQELTVGELKLDLLTRRVTVASKDLWLSTLEFNLLTYLLSNKGRVLSKAQILAHVWQDDGIYNDNLVEVYISAVRQKLQPFDLAKQIRTVRGVGYVIDDLS